MYVHLLSHSVKRSKSHQCPAGVPSSWRVSLALLGRILLSQATRGQVRKTSPRFLISTLHRRIATRHRLNMCRLAIADHDWLMVDTNEAMRPQLSTFFPLTDPFLSLLTIDMLGRLQMCWKRFAYSIRGSRKWTFYGESNSR